MGKEQIAILDPSTELRFQGPFDQVVTSVLKLTNPSGKKICFKVKTTAPKQYCVRPNSGFISPGEYVEVHVMLQPLKVFDPSEKCRHKFMVQTMYAPDGDEEADALWKTADASQVVDAKLKCVLSLDEADASQGVDAKLKCVLSLDESGTSAVSSTPAAAPVAPAAVEREPEPRPSSTADVSVAASATPGAADSSSRSADSLTPAAAAPNSSAAPSEGKKSVTIVEPEHRAKKEPVARTGPETESTLRQRHVPEAPSSRPSVTPAATNTPSSTHQVEPPKLSTATQNAAFPMPAVLGIIALAILAWVLGQYLF